MVITRLEEIHPLTIVHMRFGGYAILQAESDCDCVPTLEGDEEVFYMADEWMAKYRPYLPYGIGPTIDKAFTDFLHRFPNGFNNPKSHEENENTRFHQREDEMKSRFLDWRGIESGHECPRCGGSGKIVYDSTATYGPGTIGGSAMTLDVCDHCWGSGDITNMGPNLREMKRQIWGLNRTKKTDDGIINSGL